MAPTITEDPFECRILIRVHTAVAVVFLLYGAYSLAEIFAKGSASLPAIAYLSAWIAVNATALLVRRLNGGEAERIYVEGIALIAANFALSQISVFFIPYGEAHAAIRTILYPFFILVTGFFARRKWIPIGLSVTVAACFIAVFIVFPQYVFKDHRTAGLSNGDIVTEAALILAIALIAVLFISAILEELYDNRKKRRDYFKKISHYDQETGLPNIRELSGATTDMIAKTLGDDRVLALGGIRLLKIDEMSEKLGYENMINWMLRFSGELSASIDLWIRGIDETLNDTPVQLYRLESALLIFPIRVPARVYRAGTSLSDAWTKLLIDVLKAEHIESLVDFYGAITVFPDDGSTSAELLNNLLNVLHRSTPEQKTRFIPFNATAFDQYLRKERLKEQMLSDTFANELYAVFQPKVSVADGGCEEFEALARWKNPILGLISPGEFIPIAEQVNTMGILTKKMMKDAHAFILRCAEAGIPHVRIAFNLSPALISRDYLVALAGWITENGLGGSLEIEITEGILLNSSKETEEDFAMIKELGVSFAIDDFGTGYSNLSYLQRFNAEVIKIDKSFIDGIPDSEKSANLVKAILLMAKAFGMKVVAEGVETEPQMLFLKEAGCDLIQGFYFSRPLEAEQALAWLLR